MSCLFSENAEQRNTGCQIRCHDWFGGSSARCGNGGTTGGTNPRRESRRSVSTSSVPQSVPQGTPRKPLQGLAVPQFHDFRRIGEKIQKKRSAHIPWESTPAVPRDRPGFRLGSERRSTARSERRNRPQRPCRAPCAVESGGSTVGEWSEGQKEEKHRFFSPIPADFRRIYCKAGISLAVTSARNSGQRGRKTASLRGFGSSCK